MDQGHVVIAGGDIAQGREPLLHPPDLHRVWEAVANVLQLLVSGVVGQQEPMPVSWRDPKRRVKQTQTMNKELLLGPSVSGYNPSQPN